MIAGSGVDLEVFAPTPRRSTTGPLTFVMIARLLREKGVVEYFAAAEIVHRQMPEVKFLLVGGIDPGNPTSITDLEARDAANRAGVTWVGKVDDVRPFLAEADVVVLPSYREGTPMSLLEAAAMAKPIVATDVPGCREVVHHGVNGLLVPARDAMALANAMRDCVADRSNLAAMGEAGRALVAKHYDVRLVSEQIMSDYHTLWKQRDVP
jgi:glycosyltransferase involved in cell wall biosynthesis